MFAADPSVAQWRTSPDAPFAPGRKLPFNFSVKLLRRGHVRPSITGYRSRTGARRNPAVYLVLRLNSFYHVINKSTPRDAAIPRVRSFDVESAN